MLIGDQLPALPNNDRIMVRPDPPNEKTEGGLHIPKTAQQRANKGTLIHAGLAALDTLWDHGHQIGDRIWWGQFAGCWEEWDHIVTPGKDPGCTHAGGWSITAVPADRVNLRRCDDCGAERTQEPIYIMNAEDILANESAEARYREGGFTIHRGKTVDGQTMHVIRRPEDEPQNLTTTMTNGSDHARASQ